MYKVGIIGAGIGAEHLAAYLRLPDHFEVTCLCDTNLERAQEVAAPHGVNCVADFESVLRDGEIDIIDICLPPHLHLNACVAAMKAGKHVICEKPLATSLDDVDDIAAMSKDTGRQVFPVFQYRYGIGSAQLRALVDSGLAGKCYAGSLETHWNRDADYYSIDWRGTWTGEQGGALLGHAIHIHDLLSAFLGPVSRLYAETGTLVNDIETEDCAALSMRMESGALITSSVTLGAADNTSRLRLMFEGFTVESDHAAYAPSAQSWRFQARKPVSQVEIEDALKAVAVHPAGFDGLLVEVANALDEKPSNCVTLEDGRRSIEFVTGAYQSARTGKPVQFPLERDNPMASGWIPAD